MNKNGMVLIGVGYAVENLMDGSTKLKVHMYSTVGDAPVEEGTVDCIWLSEQNRFSAPSVYKGETIHVYSVVGSDTMYWSNVYYEKDIRREEVIMFGVSNIDKDEKDTVISGDNSHFFILDAKRGFFHFHSSTNRNEKVGYDVTFNFKEGKFQFKDTEDNKILLESLKKTITFDIENVVYNCKTYKINASDSIIFDTPKFTMNGNGLSTFNHDVINNKTVKTEGAFTQNGPSTFNSTIMGGSPVTFKSTLTVMGPTTLSMQAMTAPGGSPPHTHPIV